MPFRQTTDETAPLELSTASRVRILVMPLPQRHF